MHNVLPMSLRAFSPISNSHQSQKTWHLNSHDTPAIGSVSWQLFLALFLARTSFGHFLKAQKRPKEAWQNWCHETPFLVRLLLDHTFFGPGFFWSASFGPFPQARKRAKRSGPKAAGAFHNGCFWPFFGPHFFWPLFYCSKQAKRSGPKEAWPGFFWPFS